LTKTGEWWSSFSQCESSLANFQTHDTCCSCERLFSSWSQYVWKKIRIVWPFWMTHGMYMCSRDDWARNCAKFMTGFAGGKSGGGGKTAVISPFLHIGKRGR
jgi:hypothetical protein